MKIASARLQPYHLRLRQPVVTRTGRITHRSGWVVTLTDCEGRRGYGDVAPWAGFGAGHLRVEQELAAQPFAKLVDRLDVTSLESLGASVASLRGSPEVRHGLELAALDLLGQRTGVPIARLLKETPHAAVPVHALVADEQQTRAAVAAGIGALKIKVGAASLADDDLRLASIRASAGDRVRLRLDANAAWTTSQACAALERLARHDLEWVEQPVAAEDLAGMRAVRETTGVAIAADEAVTDRAALQRVIEAEAADLVIVKPMFQGGLIASLELATNAQNHGLAVVVTHALESVVGRTGALHLAAALPGPVQTCGLLSALAEDVAPTGELLAAALAVPPGPGLGVDALEVPRSHSSHAPLATKEAQ